LTKAADIIDALKRIVQSSEGLRNAVVEIRGRRVPVSELQPSDIATTTTAPAGPAS
jgi:hypothetical protein